MSLTTMAWLAAFAGLSALSMRRAVWGVSLYLMTFFINPSFWWWGSPIETIRWNQLAAGVLLLAVVVERGRGEFAPPAESSAPTKLVLLLGLNAVAVHLALAANWDASLAMLTLLFKYAIFYFLMIAAIRSRDDLRIVMLSFLVTAAYIGYEVTINERGNFSGGRLEGVGAAGVQNSNELASLMLAVLPMGGYIFLTGRLRDKLIAVVTTPLVLNVLLLCNSRGAFLGLIAAGAIIAVLSPRRVRPKILKGLVFASIALVILLRDPRIFERFMTTFAGSEERDGAVVTRQIIWSAALLQIQDHPLGAGGESFSTVYGARYLPRVGYDSPGRAVHNGFLNEICNWGFQGLLLRLAFFAAAFLGARRAGRRASREGDDDGAVLAACLISAIAGHLCTSMFGDYLDDEWGFWLIGLTVAQNAVALAPAEAREGAEEPRLRSALHPRPVAPSEAGQS